MITTSSNKRRIPAVPEMARKKILLFAAISGSKMHVRNSKWIKKINDKNELGACLSEFGNV